MRWGASKRGGRAIVPAWQVWAPCTDRLGCLSMCLAGRPGQGHVTEGPVRILSTISALEFLTVNAL
jgi:hypothetical protein